MNQHVIAEHEHVLDAARRANAALAATRADRWYPQAHIAALAGWINDPNGLCFYQGRYHVYFQHHPQGTDWGPMHWGHVSSADLVHWRHEPLALAPSLEEDRDGVFSGSAVEGPDGRLYAFYTGHRWRNGVDEEDGNIQVQCLAVSEDGVHFEKRGVVVEGPAELLHFRDPKVWRTGDSWYMVFGAAAADGRGEVWLYRSADLLEWQFDRILYRDPNPRVYMLECPDLFPLVTPAGERKWVLLTCPMGPLPTGYSARNGHNSGYVVGDWTPGEEFRALTEYTHLDWGHNFYAPQTFQAPDGRRLLFGWMGTFSEVLPSAQDGWTGQMTVPRELSLTEDLRLLAPPAAEVEQLRGEALFEGAMEVASEESWTLVEDLDGAAEILLELDLQASSAERMGLLVGSTEDGAQAAYVAWDDLLGRVVLDRRGTRHGNQGYRSAPVAEGLDLLCLRVVVDRGSVEVFVDDARAAITSFAFPGAGPRALRFLAESGTAVVRSLSVTELRNIWD